MFKQNTFYPMAEYFGEELKGSDIVVEVMMDINGGLLWKKFCWILSGYLKMKSRYANLVVWVDKDSSKHNDIITSPTEL